ncbi:MAG TPA: carbamoyltransferase HypF, partial [Planctomycetota bacterium]|nr:carbamoyltransferase HypF [Planctomycetota bacterium]
IGVCECATYEGQPAIELEAVVAADVEEAYPFAVAREGDRWVVHFSDTYRGVVDDLQRGAETGLISAKFHNTIVAVVADVVSRVREKTGLERVCLSGGVFQNRYLCDQVVPELEALGFEVYEQSAVPANDGGIALGQAAVARARTTARNGA